MRSLVMGAFAAYTIVHTSQASMTLTQLQPIAGFSEACSEAYNTPLTDCSLSDFYESSACSPKCVAFLEGVTSLINNECRGTTAFPDTLIGMFFSKTAVEKLCPNVEVSTVPAGGANSGAPTSKAIVPTQESVIPTKTASRSANKPQTAFSGSVASPSESSSRAAATSLVVVQSSTATLATTSTSTSSIAIPSISSQGTSSAQSDTTTTQIVGQNGQTTSVATGVGAPASASSSSTKKASPTGQSKGNNNGGGGNNDGGGGTVLDAAASGDRKSKNITWLTFSAAGLFALAWTT